MNIRFEEREIPYEKFEKVGLTQNMIDDLPEVVMEKLLKGSWTPILPINIALSNGETKTIQARLRLERKDGEVDVLVAPRSEMADLEDFTPEEQTFLRSGKIVIAKMQEGEQCFVQLDDRTNRVLYIPVSLMENNLSLLQEEMGLSNEQVAQICTGESLSVEKEQGVFTFGLDFLADGGVKIVSGDRETYENITAQEMPTYNFGIYGCWVKEPNGSLKNYVPEEEYTEEMEKELYNVGEENLQKEEQKSRSMRR